MEGGRTRGTNHDGAVAVLAQPDQLVVLANDLARALGKVERERGLVGAEVVDVEDKLLWKVLGAAPHNPTHAGVDEAVLVARDVDGHDALEAKVPLEVGHDKRRHKAARGRVDVDGRVEAALDQQVIDSLDVLVLARVGRAENGADANRVLVDQVDRLDGVNDVAVLGAVDELLVHLKVARGLFPAHLDGARHDDVGVLGRLALLLARVLPALLHSQHGQHDGLGAADARGADGARRVAVFRHGGVEEAADHGHAAVLDVGRLGVFFVVDKVFGEGLGHELFGFFFLGSVSAAGG